MNRGRGKKRKREEEEDEEEINHPNVKSAFQNIMKERTWHVRGFKDPIGALNTHKKRIKHELLYTLRKVGPQKWYIVLKCRFYQLDKRGNRTEDSSFFHGTMQTLLRREEFEDTYQSTMNKIWQAFDVYLKKGSGWILERVEKILLNTYDYKPIHISSYIPTPEALIGKKALINTQNKHNKKCFDYSVNSALHHNKIDKRQAERE